VRTRAHSRRPALSALTLPPGDGAARCCVLFATCLTRWIDP
jgi:hypothetical protein